MRLLSSTAVAFATLCRSCAEARKQLENEESLACPETSEDFPQGGVDPIEPSSPAKDQPNTAFLVTICIAVDKTAETALASLMPAVAAAAEAEVAAAEAARDSLENEGNCKRVGVEVVDSDSSEDCSDTEVDSNSSSNSNNRLFGSTSSKLTSPAAAPLSTEGTAGTAAALSSPPTEGINPLTEKSETNNCNAKVPRGSHQQEHPEELKEAAFESIEEVDEEVL